MRIFLGRSSSSLSSVVPTPSARGRGGRSTMDPCIGTTACLSWIYATRCCFERSPCCDCNRICNIRPLVCWSNARRLNSQRKGTVQRQHCTWPRCCVVSVSSAARIYLLDVAPRSDTRDGRSSYRIRARTCHAWYDTPQYATCLATARTSCPSIPPVHVRIGSLLLPCCTHVHSPRRRNRLNAPNRVLGVYPQKKREYLACQIATTRY